MAESIRSKLAHEFAQRNLILLGIVDLDVRRDYQRFQEWLSQGKNASMAWLQEHSSLRADPSLFLPGARNAIVYAFTYNLGDRLHGDEPAPMVAQYARLPDYHKFMKRLGQEVLDWLVQTSQKDGENGEISHNTQSTAGRVLVDSAPVFERALAAKTVAGFIGKNTCFIHPEAGSFLLLGEILTTLELPIDAPAAVDPDRRDPSKGGCGTCRRCQVSCPTGALNVDYSIDAARCLSYWTIEHRGLIPLEFWAGVGKYWYGCDICQLVCPYNRETDGPIGFAIRSIPPLREVVVMDQAFYERHFGGTPMTRAKRDGLRRNALIAMTVTSDPHLPEALDHLRSNGWAGESDVIIGTFAQVETWLNLSGRSTSPT